MDGEIVLAVAEKEVHVACGLYQEGRELGRGRGRVSMGSPNHRPGWEPQYLDQKSVSQCLIFVVTNQHLSEGRYKRGDTKVSPNQSSSNILPEPIFGGQVSIRIT